MSRSYEVKRRPDGKFVVWWHAYDASLFRPGALVPMKMMRRSWFAIGVCTSEREARDMAFHHGKVWGRGHVVLGSRNRVGVRHHLPE